MAAIGCGAASNRSGALLISAILSSSVRPSAFAMAWPMFHPPPLGLLPVYSEWSVPLERKGIEFEGESKCDVAEHAEGKHLMRARFVRAAGSGEILGSEISDCRGRMKASADDGRSHRGCGEGTGGRAKSLKKWKSQTDTVIQRATCQ